MYLERNNIVYLDRRNVPDYMESPLSTKILIDKLLNYYHTRGYHNVKVWAEPEIQASGRKFWYIRSNIVFDCNTIGV
jgi:hypothetical protein